MTKNIWRGFSDDELESLAAPLKKNLSDTMVSMESDYLYISDLEDGTYFCDYLSGQVYAKGGYIFAPDCISGVLIPTVMISVQPEGCVAWGFHSTFYRVFRKKDKCSNVAIDSRDSEALVEFLGLAQECGLSDVLKEDLQTPQEIVM